MITDITDFIPKYPNIDNYEDENMDFLNPYDESFYTSIYKKKEFYENKLENYEDKPSKPGQFLKHQKTIANFFSSRTPYDQLLLLHEMGTGKCLALDTPIIMYDGSIKKVQDIEAGEYLMGDDSTARKVLSVTTGLDNMYKVEQENGDSYICNQEHILCLKVDNYPLYKINEKEFKYEVEWVENNKFLKKYYPFNQTSKFKVEENIKKFIKEIKEEQILEITIKDFLKLNDYHKSLLKGYKTKVDFSYKKIVLNPYVIGYLATNKDIENIVIKNESELKYINECLHINNLYLQKNIKNDNYSIIKNNGNIPIFIQDIFKNKIIPPNYKTNTRILRIKLLRGIINSIGILQKDQSYQIKIKDINNNLYNDILFISRSLGIKCVIDNENINIFINNNYDNTTNIKISYVNFDKYYGFTLDGNCRFLLGDFTVTHNTCASINAIEKIKHTPQSTFTGAIIIAGNEGLLKNFKNELTYACTDGDYIPEKFETLTKGEKVARINKLVNEYYDFDNTYYRLAKDISVYPETEHGNNMLKEKYSNKIFVIDEVHNIRLRDKKDEKLDIYHQFHRLLHVVENCKILFLSGTPIRDSLDEFADILNLMMPLDRQISTGNKFLQDFFTRKGDLYILKSDKKDYLREILKGRISYLKAVRTDIKKIFIGKKDVGNLQKFVVYETIMSKFQSNLYIPVFENDKGVFYLDAQQASNFIFPDGSYGKNGFTKYVKENTTTKITRGESKSQYTLSDELKKEILNGVEKDDEKDLKYEKMLKNLNKFSTKFSNLIRNLLKVQNKKSVFVYYDWVTGSGSILLSLILNMFDYSKANGNETTKSPRYALINTEISTTQQNITFINSFNKKENMYGEYIGVIIGSSVIAEGYSLKNVQEEHIITPYWHYSIIDQVIARGFRFGSHQDLINAKIIELAEKNGIDINEFKINDKIDTKLLGIKINEVLGKPIDTPLNIVKPKLEIYQYASLPVLKNEIKYNLSVDLKMYETSETKDINIKNIERLLKEIAFDCALNYERNYIGGYDYQRECEYMDCDYKCYDINKDLYTNDNNIILDYSTYQLYYNQNTINTIISELKNLFQSRFQIKLNSILDYFVNYTKFEIITSIRKIINDNIIIKNKYGFPCYLKEDNNNYFLVDNLSSEYNIMTEYYTKNPLSFYKKTFEEISSENFVYYVPFIIENIFKTEDINSLQNILNNCPIEIVVQLLQNSIIAEELNIQKNVKQRKMILEIFEHSIVKIENTWVLDLKIHDILKCLNTEKMEDGWKNCTGDIIKKYKNLKKEKIDVVKNNPYGYYGAENKNKPDIFCLKKSEDKASLGNASLYQSGIVCGTGKEWKKPNMLDLVINNFKLPIPPEDFDLNKNKSLHKNISKNNKEKLINLIKSKPEKDTKLLDIDSLEDESKSTVDRYYYWTHQGVKEMCQYLRIWLSENGLMIQDENCGTNEKRKKVDIV
jgi:hypothetical protein